MTIIDLLLLAILSLIWGASFLFIKVTVLEMSPVALAAFRLTLGTIGLVILTAGSGLLGGGISKAPRKPARGILPRRLLLPSVVLALFGAVFPYMLIAWGELHVASGAAAILNATSPLFSALFSRWRVLWGQEEELSLGRVAGLLVGLLGVVVLVTGSRGFHVLGSGGLLEMAGFGAVIAASASYAIGGLFARRAFAGEPFTLPALGQNLAGTVLLLPLALTVARPAGWPSPAALGSVLALGLGGTALAYLVYYYLLSRVGATRTLSVTYLLPATALVYGAVLLGEEITLAMIGGLALILAGITLVSGLFLLRWQGTPR